MDYRKKEEEDRKWIERKKEEKKREQKKKEEKENKIVKQRLEHIIFWYFRYMYFMIYPDKNST